MMCAPSCSLYTPTQVVTQRQDFSRLEKRQFSRSYWNRILSWWLLLVHSSLETTLQRTYQILAKTWWLILSVASLILRCHHCAMSFSPRKWQLLKRLSLLKGYPLHHLQQAFIANECTFKSWYKWGWPMRWTQLNGDGNRKVMSWFQSWQTRMLCLTNSWKSFIATVLGDANPLDAAADAMDSPALLLVDLAKLKIVTIQTMLKRLIQKKRRRRRRSCHLSDSFGGHWVRQPFWSPYWILALGNEPITF